MKKARLANNERSLVMLISNAGDFFRVNFNVQANNFVFKLNKS